MDKNTGGAKPKTGTGTNNNNSNSRQGASSGATSQTTGAQSRNRSPRRENGYAARSNGGVGLRGVHSNQGSSSSSNNSSNTPATTRDSTNRRTSVPNSVARGRNSTSTQTRSNAPQRPSFTDYSPLRGARADGRNLQRPTDNLSFRRPVLRHRNPGLRTVEPVLAPLESPTGDLLPSTSRSLLPMASSSEDSDSESCSPSSPAESVIPPRSASLSELSAQQGSSRPMSTSRDARLARDLLQHEMDLMMQRDEEMARQLQEEMNHDHEPTSMARSLAMLMPGGMQGRARHFPSMPGRQDGARAARGRDRRGRGGLHLMRGPDGTVRMGFGMPGRGGGFRLMMGGGPLRRLSEPESEASLGSGLSTPDYDPSLPSNEFDPDERLLAGGLDPPDDFLSMMNDPSLMLLMLLLRAPETLYQNEAGVDLDDYEGLWELAERLGEVRRRGISEDQLNQLPTLKFKSPNVEAAATGAGSTQCQICLVDFENGDCLRCIPCKHDFHKDCIDEWLKRNATCPICRQDVKPDDR